MKNHIDKLKASHRRLNRMIDNSKSLGRQEEMKSLKRMRLQIKDKLAFMRSQQTA